MGSYSAGRQLAITEEQVLSLYDTIQGRHAVFETFITHEKFAKFNPYAAEIEATLQREACKPPIYASKATCRGFFRLDFTDRLSRVQVPALVVCGDADKPVPLENASTILAERIPDAQLVVVKDAGHFPHMEKPEVVNEAMWRWLRERVAVSCWIREINYWRFIIGLGRSVREFNSQRSPIIAGELFLPELFLPEETADQLIIDGKIGSAGYMIQHPCGIASYQGRALARSASALGPAS
jgi:Alpha/beta hydrolase family